MEIRFEAVAFYASAKMIVRINDHFNKKGVLTKAEFQKISIDCSNSAFMELISVCNKQGLKRTNLKKQRG